MIISGYLSLLVCVIGLVLYLITEKPKPTQIGWHMFYFGLIFWLFCTCGAQFHFGALGK